jgi:hypothetical protein
MQVTNKRRLTMRAADKWDSPRFLRLFLASGLYCSQAESRPAHLRLTLTVRRLIHLLGTSRESLNIGEIIS